MHLSYEFKKIYKNKVFWFTVMSLIILNIFMLSADISLIVSDELYTPRKNLYNAVKGRLTKESVIYIDEKYGELSEKVETGNYSTEYTDGTYSGYIFGDYNLFRELNEDLLRIYHYQERTSQMLEKVEANIDLFRIAGNENKCKIYKKIKSVVSKRDIHSLYDYTAVNHYINYDASSALLLIYISLVMPAVFSEEKEIHDLLDTTKTGHKKTEKWKLTFALIHNLILSFIVFTVDFMWFALFFGVEEMSAKLYYMSEYEYTWIQCTIWEYVLILLIMKLIATGTFGILCAVASRYIKKYMQSTAVCILSSIILMQTAENMLNPVNLIQGRNYFKQPAYVSLAGATMPLVFIPLICCVFTVVVFGLVLIKERNKKNGCI